MSAKLQQQIEQLGDYKAVRLLERFSKLLLEGLETPVSEMMSAVIPEVRDSNFFQKIQALSPEERSRPLTESQSIAIARGLLRYCAQEPALAPSLESVLNNYTENDRLLAGPILATGVAISMVIVASTTRFKARIGDNIVIEKTTANAELVGAITKNWQIGS